MTIKRHSVHNFGFSIVELLVSVAILGIGLSIVYSQISSMKKMVARLRLKQQIADVREAIMQTTDCQNTLRPYMQLSGSIICSGTINLKDSADTNFTASPIKNFRITASCSSTGLTVLAESSTGAVDPVSKTPLNHSNTMLNPFVGRGSASNLCQNYFQGTKRVKMFTVTPSEMAFTRSDCTALLTQQVEESPYPISPAAYNAKMQSWAAPYLLGNTMDARCTDYCRSSPRFYVGGYLADCTSSIAPEATCVCYR
jgi:prepilin-type N-terminal cleavage/methylation domain-containing protein